MHRRPPPQRAEFVHDPIAEVGDVAIESSTLSAGTGLRAGQQMHFDEHLGHHGQAVALTRGAEANPVVARQVGVGFKAERDLRGRLIRGERPNSPTTITRVVSSKPRCPRSSISADSV